MNIKTLILLLIIAYVAISCNPSQKGVILSAMNLSTIYPDSTLSILKKIDRTKLSDEDLALYALAYTKAQDKSGLDIDNDSLIRIAYNWYDARHTNRFFATCEYYMGKYYVLNDSTEKAYQCLSNSTLESRKNSEDEILCLSLYQLSRLVRAHSPKEGLKYAEEAYNVYSKRPNVDYGNKAYYLLNIAQTCLYDNYSMDSCISIAQKALSYAHLSKNQTIIADVWQELSVYYNRKGEKTLALNAAKFSYNSESSKDFSKVYALCETYINADSIEQAKQLINKIPIMEYNKYGADIFYLRNLIALKEHDYKRAKAYVDSTGFYLKHENISNSAAKDKYYAKMLQKEREQANAQYNSRILLIVSLFVILFLLFVCLFAFYSYHQKKIAMKNRFEEEERQHQLQLKHHIIQVETMRNFLLKKIDILHKLNQIKSTGPKNILLSQEDWDEIEVFLNTADNQFVERLCQQYPRLTLKDIHFLMLLRLKLPYSSLATLYHIEEKSVKQKLFLLKDKLNIKDKEISTREFIDGF